MSILVRIEDDLELVPSPLEDGTEVPGYIASDLDLTDLGDFLAKHAEFERFYEEEWVPAHAQSREPAYAAT